MMSPKSGNLSVDIRSAPAEWVAYRERGSALLLRSMAFLSYRLGRRTSRLLLYFIAGYFWLFAPSARRNSRVYLRRALGREPHSIDRFRHLLTFASTVHDRLYLVDQQFHLFDVSVEGEHWMKTTFANGQGAFLMGAHLGSFDMIRSVARRQPGLRVSMAMYEENAQKINSVLRAINPGATPEIIGLGHLEAMLRIREDLDRGVFVGVLADRTLREETAHAANFLGAAVRLPVGPMRVAALLRRPVVFMAGLYRGGNRYHVVFEPLADFSATPAAGRDAAVRAAIDRYGEILEKYCRSDPYNWFNFFDFWRDGDSAPKSHRH